MGEVYRATDQNLGREVAIKVLPQAFAQDAERLARFEREARTLAALNHPNIAIVHGLENGALVMELVEGPTLADRIGARPMPPDEVLPIARQIAEALEAAHEQGIIHRDLKPANIKVRDDGTVKVLDFGLAKAMDGASGPGFAASAAHSLSPTITTPAMTQLGVVLGTAAYMAPEQARGHRVDARVDIWAFGCVLFEMLTGMRAFEGSETTDTMAAVLKLEPAWSRIPATTPPEVTRLVRRCLEKDRRKRLQAIGDARIELEETGIRPLAEPRSSSVSRRRERIWMAVAALAGLIAIALGAASLRTPDEAAPESLRAALALPAGLELDGSGPPEFTLSPDGRTLAFLARDAAAGYQRLYVRRLDDEASTVVPGSETAEGPFFSPDGRWLAFAVGASITGIHPPELRKFSLDTKLTQTVATVEDYFGGYWTEQGSIVFVGSQPRGLYSVPSGGGTPMPLVAQVRINGKDAARPFAWPEPLPGGAAVLITDWGTSSFGRLAVLDLATREFTSLGLDGAGARYVPGGYIVYGSRDASLMAVPFDPATRRTTGTPVALMRDIAFGRNNVPVFAFSPTGTFLYAQGYLRWSRREPLRMIRVAPSGSTTVLPFEPQLFRRGFALSPAGDAIIAGTWDDSRWVFDLARRTRTKLPVVGTVETHQMAWSPDGQRLALSGSTTDNTGVWSAFAQHTDGSGSVIPLGKPIEGEIHVGGWLPDNMYVIAYTFTSATSGATFIRIGPDGRADTLFVDSGTVGAARPSPDGRWLAYDSTTSGNFDVYIAPLSGSQRRVTVSHEPGSRNPAWSHDGRELYYLRDRSVFAVAIEPASDSLKIGPERKLFEWNVDTNREYVVGRDGAFYTVDTVPDAAKQTLIQLRTNWFDEVKRLASQR
jgi:serine/threonine-protein kinase